MKKLAIWIFLTCQLLTINPANAAGKLLVKAGQPLPPSVDAELLVDYGSFQLFAIDPADRNQIANNHNFQLADEMNSLLFDSYRIDTQDGNHKGLFNQYSAAGDGLHLIQFVGPIKQNWLDLVKSNGGQLIHYVANNGYLVWANDETRQQLDQMAGARTMLQFSAPYVPALKTGQTIAQRLHNNPASDEVVDVAVQLANSPMNQNSKALIESLAVQLNTPWSAVMNFHSIRISVKVSDIEQITQLADTYWVGEYFERTLDDEVQNVILSGDLTPDNSGPAMTGYATFLAGLGFPASANSYPVVDVTDDGIGNGQTNTLDQTFHEIGNINNPSRIMYNVNCTAGNNSAEGVGGHGHLNTNIVGGFEARTGFPYIDPNGYIRTQGVNPYTRLAGHRIFGPGFSLTQCGGTDQGLIQSVQDNGADIMSNSWGCSGCASSYDDSSQAFDVGTRDADLSQPGNQQMIMLFAAGNSGSTGGTVGTPGNGKNMITVGASENQRPSDEDGNWIDGCNTGPSGADNAMDVIGFSSRGPAPGGRTKPEVIAPGTHIHGTASTSSNYNGTGVCDQFRPGGQTVIAASSGTSHSTPAVAGVTSLAYYWLQNPPASLVTDVTDPSPAMMKAYLIAHPTYLTGVSANDTLPSNSQGYGMPNMGLMFDDTSKYAIDQSTILDNTGETFQWIGSAADPAKPVRIVMTYTDQAGAVGTSPQVNNLDLTVETGGSTYLGNEFNGQFSITGGSADTANNYEAVFLPAGTATDLTITITAANIAGDGIPNSGDGTDQDFALVCYNCAQDPTYTLSVVDPAVNVCSPDDATFAVNVGSILGYNTPVTLTTLGLPAGATDGYSVNPVTPGNGSVLTLSNLGAVAPGDYQMSINGASAGDNKTTNISMSLYDGVPAQAGLSAPANGATDVPGNGISFDWVDAVGAQEYLFELSDMSDFSNIIESQTVTSSAYTSALSLNPNADYYWRVQSSNTCGSGSVSNEFSFTTANEICVTPNASIPDNNSAGVDVDLSLADTDLVTNLIVKLEVQHTWVGDLIATLTHVNSGTTVTLMDRPGSPASTNGCSANDIDVTFDDFNGTEPVEGVCGTSPAIGGVLIPEEPLYGFDGVVADGIWRLNISDNVGQDTGNITSVCLIPSTANDLIFAHGYDN
ncbi:S8 family serine peptidase [Marinicella sediminis]|uniref:S8 family serine peptidase n=1 Tax=Marinicella sediminis TaxID=1792834 RepID=A0ABV7JKD8_9GAMM|nr:S8 family serine peptidase [Marinicella sediminis]